MKKLASFLLAFCLLTSIFAQNRPKVSRATIHFDDKNISQLARLGLECDHGELRDGHSLTSDFTDVELREAEKAGFRTEILIDDVVAFYKNRSLQPLSNERGGAACNPELDALWPVPTHWNYGTMAGFFTLDEAFDQLDLMHQLYPDLVSIRKSISDSIVTHEGQSVYSVIISDNVSLNENENQVLYSALHHAREPEGLSQLIFFMWYLLEHYGQDAEITNLVDNLELHFVPILNPDGYIYNQSTEPDGGGYWRKNRRDNLDGTFGVDLNRNYGHQWGFDDTGSSPNPNSGTYRGPSAFSEPESRAMRDYCNAHEFKIALNYHTFGNLLIHPWGFADQPTDDQPVFRRITNWIGRKNNYKAGLASETVNYQVNGTSDDWMYGEQFGKPKIYALTPEIGKTGFWPGFDEIVPLAQGTMWQNLTTAKFALNAALFEDKREAYLPNALSGTLPFELHFLGLEPTAFTVFMSAASSNVTSVSNSQSFVFELNDVSKTGEFTYTLNPNIKPGDEILFEYIIDDVNGNFYKKDTLRKIFGGEVEPIFSSPPIGMTGWSSAGGNTWTTTTEDFKSAPVSFHDSPGGPYQESKTNVLTSTAAINLPAVFLKARLRFWTKWRIEANYDYAQVACNGMPLCGIFTRPGSDFQASLEPIFDGFQNEWVEESMDLAMFAGQNLTFSFTMKSDGFTEENGFYFDDFNVEIVLEDGSIQTMQLEMDDFKLTSQPNPANDFSTISWEGETASNLLIFNGLGQKIRQFELENSPENKFEIDLTGWSPGLYFYQIETANGRSILHKIMVGR